MSDEFRRAKTVKNGTNYWCCDTVSFIILCFLKVFLLPSIKISKFQRKVQKKQIQRDVINRFLFQDEMT